MLPALVRQRALAGDLGLRGRQGGRCEVTPGCPRPGVSADHIIPAAVLAERDQLHRFFDAGNLRCACRVCNSRRHLVVIKIRS